MPTWVRELLLVAVLYGGYEASRGIDPGSAAVAVRNGMRFLHWEGALHLDPEHALTSGLIRVTPLAVAAAYIYSTLHYVITPVVLVWLFHRHRDVYARARTSLAIGTLVGLLGFVFVPTAPPRLLPGGGIPDALFDERHWGWWGGDASVPSFLPKGFANQFAAMPSLHVGWALWCGVLIWRHAARGWVRWLGALYPVVIALVVLSTGNHYLLDVVGGVVAMAVGCRDREIDAVGSEAAVARRSSEDNSPLTQDGTRSGGTWIRVVTRQRSRDNAGKEHAQHFDRKVDAQRWLDSVAASQVRGDYVDPKLAKATVDEWCQTWLAGYRSRRPRTVRQAEVHLKLIRQEFGSVALSAVRPSHVKAWTAKLKAEGRADSYVYALHSRLSQILSDAVHDGVIARNPCSRRTSPRTGSQRPYVATTEQIWALHDAVPAAMSASILLGAFVGLRLAEVAALRTSDVDFLRGVITPTIQWPADPLKSETSRTAVPIPRDLAQLLARCLEANLGRGFIVDEYANPANPWTIQRA